LSRLYWGLSLECCFGVLSFTGDEDFWGKNGFFLLKWLIYQQKQYLCRMSSNNAPLFRPLMIFQIGSLVQKMRRECDIIFREKEFPLEMDQIPVLLALYYRFPDGASQQEIGEQLQRDKASINRTITFLVRNDIVNVVQDDTNKRRNRVGLTATGKKLAMQAENVLEKFDSFLSATFTAEEKVRLDDLLQKLIATVNSL